MLRTDYIELILFEEDLRAPTWFLVKLQQPFFDDTGSSSHEQITPGEGLVGLVNQGYC